MKTIFPSALVFSLGFLSVFCLNAQVLDLQFPMVNGEVKTICIHGNTLYIGGTFTSVGGNPRKNIAAIDIPTKSVSTWKVSANGDVTDIKAANGKVYFCGKFTQVNSSNRNAFAAVDSIDGLVDPLNPTIVFPGIPGMQTGTITSIAIASNTLYLAGYFLSVNGVTHKNIAALDLVSGNLTSFNTSTDIPINLIRIEGNILYLGGPFTTVNNSGRSGFAAVNRISGGLLPWTPSSGSPGNTINSILPDGDSVFISGFFLNLNNLDHCFLAKTDMAGKASNWKPVSCNPPYNTLINALYIWDSQLIAAGSFTEFDGTSRINLSMADKNTGAVNSWAPDPDDEVLSLAGNDSLIVVGGRFDVISGTNRPNLAVYSKYGQQSSTGEPRISAIKLSGYPNPTQSFFTIPLVQVAVKNVSIYTIEGKVAHAAYQLKERALIINTEQLHTGEYIVQIETADGNRYWSLFTRLKG